MRKEEDREGGREEGKTEEKRRKEKEEGERKKGKRKKMKKGRGEAKKERSVQIITKYFKLDPFYVISSLISRY